MEFVVMGILPALFALVGGAAAHDNRSLQTGGLFLGPSFGGTFGGGGAPTSMFDPTFAATSTSTLAVAAPIQLALSGLPTGYRLPDYVRDGVVDCVSQSLQRNIDPVVGVRDVAWSGGILPCAVGGMGGSSLGAYNNWMAGYEGWNRCAQTTPQFGSSGGIQGSTNGAGAWGNTNAVGASSSGGSCPPEYGLGLQYGAGELRSVCANNNQQFGSTNDNCGCTVYRCRNNSPMPSRWCGLEGYQPGSGSAWEMAWEWVGTCNRPLPTMGRIGIGCVGDGYNTISVPLRIVVDAPGTLGESIATGYVIRALQSGMGNVLECVRSQDVEQLNSVMVIVAPYDERLMVDETREPTPKPTRRPTPNPTPRPTSNPTPRPTLSPTPRPTRRPTPRPTTRRPTQRPTRSPVEEVTQVIPLQLNLEDIAPGYLPSPSDRDYILSIILDVIRENLDPSLELVDVDYIGDDLDTQLNTRNYPKYDGDAASWGGRRLENSLYLPVEVTVRGREGVIDIALPDLLEIAEEHKDEIAERLRDYDYETFKNVEVDYEAKDLYDVDSSTVATNHPVQLFFENVNVGYELSEYDRDSFIRFMKEMLQDRVGFDWDVLQVTHAGRFEVDATTPHLPTRVTVRGPSDLSAREALSYVLTILRDRKAELTDYLKDLDRDTFRNVVLSIESRDRPDVEGPTLVEDPIRAAEHRVELFVDDLCAGYEDRLDSRAEDRDAIVRFFRELLSDNLPNIDDALEVVDVQYAGRLGYSSGRYSIPLIVDVRAPESLTDKISAYVEQILEDNAGYFKDFLESLDRNAFQCATVDVDEYDESFIIDGPSAADGYKETIHPVRIDIKNAPNRWRLSDTDRASITRFVRNLLEDNLYHSFDVVDVEHATIANSHHHDLLITVGGPRAMADFSLAYVMEVLNDHKRDIEDHIRDRKPGQLGDSYVTLELYDPSTPTPVLMETTEHNVQVEIENVPDGYQLLRLDRASITRYVKEILEVNLERPLELIEVSYAGNDGLLVEYDGAIAIPLRVLVQGPTTESDFHISFVMDILENGKRGLIDRLQSLDADAFQYVNVQFGTYDFVSVPAPSPGTGGTRFVETVHPVMLNIGNVSDGYRLTRDHKTRILSFVEDLLEDYLDDSFQLVNVALASRGRRLRDLSSSHGSRRLGDVSLPLRITVRGPADLSEVALSYVRDALRNRRMAILQFLDELDWDTFRSADISFGTFDLDEYDGVDASVGAQVGAVMNTEHDNVPIWVWFLVAMSILLVITCCCCICCHCGVYKYWKNKVSRYDVEKEVTIEEDLSTSDKDIVTTEVVPYQPQPQIHLVPIQPNTFPYPAPVLQIEAGSESDAPTRKKYRKKKKKKRESKMLQIDAAPNLYSSELTLHSGTTFQKDPPSESWSYSQAPSVAPAEDRLQICQAPREQDKIMKGDGRRRQSHSTEESSNAIVRYTKEPSGDEWADVVQRQIDSSDGDSYVTQPPQEQPKLAGRSGVDDNSDIFATFDDPCFSVGTGVGDSHDSAVAEAVAAAQRDNRHRSSGVDSVDDTNDWLDYNDSAFLMNHRGKSF